ncbi:MAG: pyridoxal-phosphate dependent enzyme [Pseudomonadota bacterium]
MQITENPWRGQGLPDDVLHDVPWASEAARRAEERVASHLIAGETPLVAASGLGCETWVKDERGRMGMGSFKALGAAYVIACDAMETGADDMSTALVGYTYATASAGNHGLSLAFGAARFGAEAVVFIANTVPESFADRLRSHGATVVRQGEIYEESMDAAMHTSREKGWTLLSDSSWAGYYERPHRLMEGYLVMAAEAARQMPAPPTHIFLQAGVGGLACACALHFREVWGPSEDGGPKIIVVEPDRAPALEASVRAGKPVETTGAVSAMGRLDCKVPSFIALKQLARDADQFALISEDEAQAILAPLAAQDLASTPSGAAGIACLKEMGLGDGDRALCILSEKADG